MEEGEQTEYFKKLSDRNLEQCGTLAEQLICLRNDLDRSRFDVLRIQRQRSSSLRQGKNSSMEIESEINSEFIEPEVPPQPAKIEKWVNKGSPSLNKSTNYTKPNEEENKRVVSELDYNRKKLPPKVASILKNNKGNVLNY
jgi:hypothetical protein